MSEYTEVEQPFLQQLQTLGWTIIDQGVGVPQSPGPSLRSSFRQWILNDVFDSAVSKLNQTEDGESWLTTRQLEDLKSQILRQSNRTMLEANEANQALFFKAQVDVNEITGEADPVVKLIDFHNPEKNQFHAINQFRIDTPGCVKSYILPDIVLFVNGIPIVVIECKKRSETCANPMQEAFEQLQRYMGKRIETERAGLKEGEPRFFHTNLIVVRTSGTEADFGSITSGDEHYYTWKTLYPSDDTALAEMNEQQQLIAGMLNKSNLLQILRTCSVFMDMESGSRIKVVCRYQQFRAANKIAARLRARDSAFERSGVIWHTQGSGKSLTMIFLARMMRASRDLNDFKIILVNDREDLEYQLSKTATLIGGRVNVIDSTKELKEHLATDSSDINMVMVHKFLERNQTLSNSVAEALGTYQAIPSAKTFGVVNTSDRIVLMIDEAHRTQSSDLGENLLEAFPNATRIAFTGTPLITERHGEKKTHKRFGDYIDTYRIKDSINDGATLQILYEGKTADTALSQKYAFDKTFEDLFRERSQEDLLAIKKKYGATGDIFEAEKRIDDIAEDLVEHYVNNILPNGFKAQVVCHSKLACIRYQKSIEKYLTQRIEKESVKTDADPELVKKLRFLKTAVVISSDGTNEAAFITQARKEASRMKAVENFCRPFNLDDPDKEYTGICFLIVCDMLITGFDAPIEQVMYIDKKIKEHTLLQAIARTNRVKKGKQRGYIVDYIGLANHLTEALTLYAFSDEIQELHNGLQNILSELPVLEERYQRLLQLFASLGVSDIKEFVTGLLPDLEADVEVVHRAVRVLKDEKLRADFEVFLKKFLMSMDIILPHSSAQSYRVPAKRFGYIMQVAKERYKDTSIDFGDAGEKVKALINEHLVSLGVNPKIAPVELFADDFLEKLAAHASGNDEAKASEMEHAIRKHCTVHHDEDPAFYSRLSEKVDALIEKHHDEWNVLVEKLSELRTETLAGRDSGHGGMSREATVFYEYIVQITDNEIGVKQDNQVKLKAVVEEIVKILQEKSASIDFWQNPDKQRHVRGLIKSEIAKSGIEELKEIRERIAVEVMKLAKNRYHGLVKSAKGDV